MRDFLVGAGTTAIFVSVVVGLIALFNLILPRLP